MRVIYWNDFSGENLDSESLLYISEPYVISIP
jgi:hypothetical protein